jgi:hypothetical protein
VATGVNMMPTEASSASRTTRMAHARAGRFSRTYRTVAETDVSRLAAHTRASRYTASEMVTVMFLRFCVFLIVCVLDGAAGFGGLGVPAGVLRLSPIYKCAPKGGNYMQILKRSSRGGMWLTLRGDRSAGRVRTWTGALTRSEAERGRGAI